MTLPSTKFLATLGAAVLGFAFLLPPAASAADEDLPGWAFQEDVDLSDASRWTSETGQSSNTSSYDLPENVSFDSSGLTVRGEERTHRSANYTSGDAKGLDIVIPNYARVEAVGSVPFGPGLWPALMWLRPLDSAHGEIDLMEVFGDDARVAATIHNEYGPKHRSLQGSARWNTFANADPTGRHTYVMEKTPNRIVISVDGTVILDAGPEDVRPGFDWKAVFERPTATWYPRVTLQIGCPPTDPGCGIGLPASGWQGGEMKLESLRIWRMAAPGENPPPVVQPPVVQPPVVQPPVVQPPVVQPPVVQPPVVQPPAVEDGAFRLRPGQELRHRYAEAETGGSEATVAFRIPENLGTGVMYHSLQVLSSDDGRTGVRATVTLKASGSIRLTLAQVRGNRSTILQDTVVAPRGTYAPGDDVQVAVRVADGAVSAKAWAADAAVPGWQLVQPTRVDAPSGADGVLILGYLSKRAPNAVVAPWSDLAPTTP